MHVDGVADSSCMFSAGTWHTLWQSVLCNLTSSSSSCSCYLAAGSCTSAASTCKQTWEAAAVQQP
jgi:hypothetical protein